MRVGILNPLKVVARVSPKMWVRNREDGIRETLRKVMRVARVEREIMARALLRGENLQEVFAVPIVNARGLKENTIRRAEKYGQRIGRGKVTREGTPRKSNALKEEREKDARQRAASYP